MEFEPRQPKREEVKIIPLEELYKMYGYTPRIKNKDEIKSTLELRWTEEDFARMIDALQTVVGQRPAPYESAREIVQFGGIETFEAKFNTSMGGGKGISLTLFKKGIEIASLESYKRGVTNAEGDIDTWALTHRMVSEQYRGQNIGSHMLKILEAGFTHMAKTSGRTVVLEIGARQLGIINFALKNGYKLASNEDKERLNLAYEGDRSKIMVATLPELPRTFLGGAPRHGYMYEVKTLQSQAKEAGLGDLGAEEIWNTDLTRVFKGHNERFIPMAFNINFVKEFRPEV